MATRRRRRISVDGHAFKSEVDYRKYLGLQEFIADGRLSQLEIYPVYPLVVRDVEVDHFEPTFRFYDHKKKRWRIILVGASINKALQIKVHLFETLYDIEVERWA